MAQARHVQQGHLEAAVSRLQQPERLADILRRMRHDGCGGLAGKAELLTGIDGASSRPVRRIVLLAGAAPRDT